MAGCEPAVNNLYPSVKFPVSRGTPSISPYCTWFHGDVDEIRPPYISPTVFTILLTEKEKVTISSILTNVYLFQPLPLSQENIVVRINENSEFNFLKHCQIHESIIIPPSFFLVS